MEALFTAGASDVVVQVTVEDSTTSANVVNTRTVTVPGGTTLRVRTQITIPATGTTGLRFKAGRVSGDTVNMTGVRFNAI